MAGDVILFFATMVGSSPYIESQDSHLGRLSSHALCYPTE
ncbi:hypothetical protein HMPREF9057_01333 [Actinomyces sp. oral taxon 171 str. F0337]|nr:hypothetical protein HMPREF9057_01333 [Actinomyces sp. oral taxon 171 str. F0337]